MKRKQVGTIFMACCMAAMLGGCTSALETGETVVVPKTEAGADADGAGENKTGGSAAADGMGAGADGSGAAGESAGGGSVQNAVSGQIAEQVGAPQTFQMNLTSGKITVTADAEVIVPDADGFKKKRVRPRVFTQEDYDAVNRALLDGGKLWNRDSEAMAGSNGFTKEEVQERLDMLKKEQASGAEVSELYGGEEIDYGEMIAKWEKMLEAASDEAIMIEEDAVVQYVPGDDEKNSLDGRVTANGTDYYVWLSNSMDNDWYWSIFKVAAPGGSFSWVEQDGVEGAAFSTEEIRREAEELVEELGFSEYGYAGEEYYMRYGNEASDGTLEKVDTGYCIHFTRKIDGINVNYAAGEGLYAEQASDITWPAEFLDLTYNKDGFVCFDWESPYEIEDVSDEYVFLLPFSDIQDIFEKMMAEKYGSADELENVVKAEYHIERVQLGYMRVRENGAATDGMMLPVWDFYGTETLTMKGGDSAEGSTIKHNFPYESLLTINATDGTIVDKKLGY